MELAAELGAEERTVTIEAAGEGRFRIVIDGASRIIDARQLGPTTWSLILEGQVVTVDIDPGKNGELLCDVGGIVVPVKMVDARRRLLEKAQAAAAAAQPRGPTPIAAPMPGKVVKILVGPGDNVTAGQPVAVVEAMKMENEIRSSRAGAVVTVHVKEGQTVEGQEALITVG
jgi:biotin carboxyl carrier protein